MIETARPLLPPDDGAWRLADYFKSGGYGTARRVVTTMAPCDVAAEVRKAALRGRGGGYRLSRAPEDYTVGGILKAADGSLAPVSCLEDPDNPCPRAADCRTLPVWKGLDRVVEGYLESVTLRDLMRQRAEN